MLHHKGNWNKKWNELGTSFKSRALLFKNRIICGTRGTRIGLVPFVVPYGKWLKY